MASKSSDHLDNKLPHVCWIANDMEDYSSSPTKEEMIESQLKQMEQKANMGCETTLSYVVSFKNALLCTKCIKSSPQYDSEMDLNVLVREIFTPNQWWASRSVLFEAVNTFSLLLSFRPILKHILSAVTVTGIKNTSKAMSPGSCGLDALSTS
jgi:hypothetical protein